MKMKAKSYIIYAQKDISIQSRGLAGEEVLDVLFVLDITEGCELGLLGISLRKKDINF